MPRRLLILLGMRRLHLSIGLQQLLVRLLRWMRLLKAKQRAVVGRLLRPRTRSPQGGVLVPIVPIAPRPHVGAFLAVETALQIIDLRLELGDPPFEGGVFNDPRI